MATIRRSALRRAARFFCALFLLSGPVMSTQARADGPSEWRDAKNLAELTDNLEHWLDDNSPYQSRDPRAQVRLVAPSQMRDLVPNASWQNARPRGFYDPALKTIYLIRPWSSLDPVDVSVLLHELTHHRQQTARHWYCPGAQELPAYRLQEAWLTEQGEIARINWIAAVLDGGCTPRDIHPD